MISRERFSRKAVLVATPILVAGYMLANRLKVLAHTITPVRPNGPRVWGEGSPISADAEIDHLRVQLNDQIPSREAEIGEILDPDTYSLRVLTTDSQYDAHTAFYGQPMELYWQNLETTTRQLMIGAPRQLLPTGIDPATSNKGVLIRDLVKVAPAALDPLSVKRFYEYDETDQLALNLPAMYDGDLIVPGALLQVDSVTGEFRHSNFDLRAILVAGLRMTVTSRANLNPTQIDIHTLTDPTFVVPTSLQTISHNSRTDLHGTNDPVENLTTTSPAIGRYHGEQVLARRTLAHDHARTAHETVFFPGEMPNEIVFKYTDVTTGQDITGDINHALTELARTQFDPANPNSKTAKKLRNKLTGAPGVNLFSRDWLFNRTTRGVSPKEANIIGKVTGTNGQVKGYFSLVAEEANLAEWITRDYTANRRPTRVQIEVYVVTQGETATPAIDISTRFTVLADEPLGPLPNTPTVPATSTPAVTPTLTVTASLTATATGTETPTLTPSETPTFTATTTLTPSSTPATTSGGGAPLEGGSIPSDPELPSPTATLTTTRTATLIPTMTPTITPTASPTIVSRRRLLFPVIGQQTGQPDSRRR